MVYLSRGSATRTLSNSRGVFAVIIFFFTKKKTNHDEQSTMDSYPPTYSYVPIQHLPVVSPSLLLEEPRHLHQQHQQPVHHHQQQQRRRGPPSPSSSSTAPHHGPVFVQKPGVFFSNRPQVVAYVAVPNGTTSPYHYGSHV
jgi:hypothetical protein